VTIGSAIGFTFQEKMENQEFCFFMVLGMVIHFLLLLSSNTSKRFVKYFLRTDRENGGKMN
jgi:hypothetical protein